MDRPTTCIGIGVATKPYPSFRLPGWNKLSIGYHSDDGHLFVSDDEGGRSFGPAYGTGDAITVEHDASSSCINFYKNYEKIGTVSVSDASNGFNNSSTTSSSVPYYPVFGADGNCVFDVQFES